MKPDEEVEDAKWQLWRSSKGKIWSPVLRFQKRGSLGLEDRDSETKGKKELGILGKEQELSKVLEGNQIKTLTLSSWVAEGDGTPRRWGDAGTILYLVCFFFFLLCFVLWYIWIIN